MQEINGALFLNVQGLFFLSLLFARSTEISPVTIIYTSPKSHEFNLSIDVLNLIYLLALYVPPD